MSAYAIDETTKEKVKITPLVYGYVAQTVSYTVNAGTVKNLIYDVTDIPSDGETGKNPIGIVNIKFPDGLKLSILNFYISRNYAYITVFNNTSQNITVGGVGLGILYQ